MNSEIETLKTAVFGNGKLQEPGLKREMRDVQLEIYGNGKFGMKQKVAMLWSRYVWILCSLSALGGVAGTMIAQHFIQMVFK